MLREDRHSRLGISEVAAVTEVLVSTAGRYFNSLDTAIYQEFNNLSEHLSTMHDEIAKVQADKIKGDKLPSAGEELDAIVKATETATDSIMEAAEDMMGADIADPAAYKAVVDDACMRIFEACSFQDITGQRITKVLTALTYIEERISQFATMASDAGIESDDTDDGPSGDEALLNGPQMNGEGVSQDDVDAMMNGTPPEAAPEAAPEPVAAAPLSLHQNPSLWPPPRSLNPSLRPSPNLWPLPQSLRLNQNPSPNLWPLRQSLRQHRLPKLQPSRKVRTTSTPCSMRLQRLSQNLWPLPQNLRPRPNLRRHPRQLLSQPRPRPRKKKRRVVARKSVRPTSTPCSTKSTNPQVD